jgi:hypothetical protein
MRAPMHLLAALIALGTPDAAIFPRKPDPEPPDPATEAEILAYAPPPLADTAPALARQIAEMDAIANRAERYLRRTNLDADRAHALSLHFGALGDARQAARQELQRLHRELSDARDQARARAAEPPPVPEPLPSRALAVACPRCGAASGEPCSRLPQHLTHRERLRRWQLTQATAPAPTPAGGSVG